MTRKLTTYLNNAVSALCIALISAQPVLGQSIVADGNGPQVIDSANGTPMVMINTPDGNGVSHNTYTQFGVGSGGAILNNVTTNAAQTGLAGIVQGNSNLAGGGAGIILNEVTSTNPSVLNGYLEVAGQRADVIVANPNGITCDGCGFINTNQLTITTGTPGFEGARFTGFSVDGGAVAIGTGGLDATDTTTFDLLSRQITVAGAVTGQRIRVVAGRNDVLYATGEVTQKADDGSTAPALAIDSTALGGMFANSITITSTEDGVGVRAPQNMAANAGGMTITADGRLVMNNASASQNVTVHSTQRVEIQGNVVAQQVAVTSAEDLVLAANARLVAQSAAILNIGGDLDVRANAELTATSFDLDIAGAFRVGNDADVISVQTLDLGADSLINMGTLASTAGELRITTGLDLTNEGLMFGDTSVVLRSDAAISNNGGSIIANGSVDIRGGDNDLATAFTNQFGGVVETITGDISIAAVSFGNLREAPLVDDALVQETGGDAGQECTGDTCFDPITVGGQITEVGEAAQIISAGNITLTGTDVTNAYSLISAGGDININVDTLDNIGLNAYRDTGSALEFVGAVFGTIEARGNINGTVAGYVNNGAYADNTVIISGPTDTDTSDITVDSIGNPDLLVVNADPDAEFLVETRPEFVDLDQFVSSDYFLSAIEYDPELRRFGDAYAEALFIRKQLQELLGQLILTTGIDERAQIEAMYNNAINALENLDLTPGVALTPDQIGALTSDIIWLEETVIDGQTVLAPKVYLANPEIRFAGLSGATITGQNVNFNTGNFDNSGNIRATDTISIAVSDTFRSTGGTVSAENIAVIGNNIEIVSDARTIVSDQGIRLVKLPVANPMLNRLLADASWTDREDRALQTATFAAGSTIVLTARDAITTAGAQISAGDNITLLAGGDVTIGALALASETGRTSGSNRNRIERFDHMTTSLNAGGDITILSSGNVPGQNDIVLEGANVTAGGNVGLIAQDGDLILASVADVYFRDYARKSGNVFRKKIRRSQTLNVTNQTTTITGASIMGMAANNIRVEGGRFDIPGVANTDLAPGQLSLVSVNGSSTFTAPTDVRASSSYKSTSILGGLITNSRDKRSLITDSVGTVANTAGDIALNSGADLTLTSVDFNAGGQFVTKVTGTTYLLAAIDVEYHSLTEHRDNGVIMTDIRSEDLAESVTFNGIEAAGGVLFDKRSQIVLAGVRNPLIDSIQAGGWTADREDTGRMRLAGVYLGDPEEEQSEPERRDGEWIPANEEDDDENPHWREGGEWSEEGEFLVQQVALPTGTDGAEYAYLDGVLGRDSTINDPIELVSYSFYEKKQAISPAFKALLTIVVTQGLAGPAGLAGQLGLVNPAVAATTTSAATAATVTTTGLAVNAAAASVIVGTLDGAVAGDIDMEKILGEAAFAGVSAGLTASVDLKTLGGNWEGMAWAETAVGFGDGLSFANLVEQGIDATLTAGLTAAVYEDVDFLDSFKGSVASATINLAMADLQSGIGDGVTAGRYTEGDLSHAVLHGLVGCAAAEALDGDCASGAAAGIAQSIYAGTLHGTAPDGGDLQAYNAWRTQVADNAQLIGASVGFFTSGGRAANVSNGGSIAQSGAKNNYLSHTDWQLYLSALSACGEDAECLSNAHRAAETTSLTNEHDYLMCRQNGNCARIIAEIEEAEVFRREFGQASQLVVAIQERAYYASRRPNVAYDTRDTGLTGTNLEYGAFHAQHCSGVSAANCVRNFELTVDIRRLGDQQTQLGAVGVIGTGIAMVGTGCGGGIGCFVLLGANGAMAADQLETGLDNRNAVGTAEQTNYVAALMAGGLSQEQAQRVEFWTGMGLGVADLSTLATMVPKAGRLSAQLDNVGALDGAGGLQAVDEMLPGGVATNNADDLLLLENRFPNSNPPEHSDFPITARPAPEGTRGFMAVEEGQVNPATGQVDRPGAFLSDDPINSVGQVRNDLAVRDDWKPNPTHVQEFEVVPGTQIQESTVGPQTNIDGTILPGGGNQTQVLVPQGTYPGDVLVPIGPARPIE